ncbi:MAG: MFS transporter [Acidobacteria bacterium]|nr:MFS transporter [Acidobacteriota bacterium]
MKPTGTRHKVIIFAVTLAVLSYIDRVAISTAAPFISKDLGFDKTQMGWIFSSFAFAYALFEIPGGWMGDWMGARKVLMRIVVWWSFFTAATGWMWNFWSMVVARALFGAGEAGCFPNLTKAFTTWLPKAEQVRAQGVTWLSARWGGAFTGPLVIAVFSIMNWRSAFVVFGAIGVVWAILFYRWYRDSPGDHPDVNKAELAIIEASAQKADSHGDVPWGQLLASGSVWGLWLQYFALSYPWYFFITWLPTYLQEHWKVTGEQASYLGIFPLFFGGIGAMFSGWLSPRIGERLQSTKKARRMMATVGFAGAATMMFSVTLMPTPLLAMIVMGLASFCNDLVMPNAWGACMDVGGKYAGTLSGSMNMMGNFAGLVAPIVAPYVLLYTANDWNRVLAIMAAVYVVGAITWPFIDPVKPLEQN